MRNEENQITVKVSRPAMFDRVIKVDRHLSAMGIINHVTALYKTNKFSISIFFNGRWLNGLQYDRERKNANKLI